MISYKIHILITYLMMPEGEKILGIPLHSKVWAECSPRGWNSVNWSAKLGEGGSDPPGPSSSGITAALLISPPTMNTFLFLIIKANFEYYLYRPLFILPLNKRIKSHMRLTTMQSIILLLNGFKSMRHHIIMQKMLIQLSICQTVITL